MLARTAESMFWLARYIERMDNVARLLEAAQRMAGLSSQTDEWRSALIAAGCDPGYAKKYDTVTAIRAANYLGFDKENPSSIMSSLEAARNNARSMRTALTRDMWDAVNGAWIEGRRIDASYFLPERLPDAIDWVKTVATRFLGAYSSTMLRNDIYYFTRLGTYLERADNTARILDVKYHVLLPREATVGGPLDYYQWTSILQAVSGLRAYYWVYRTEVKPLNIAELLLLKPEMPRAVRTCYDQIEQSLNALSAIYDGRAGKPHETCGALAQELRTETIGNIFQYGLHEYLTDVIDQTTALGGDIQEFYMR
jgi:uncharacterized alpha-E superfamily protein